MAINLGSAYGKVSIDNKGFIDGIKKSKESLGTLEDAGKKLGETMKNTGKILTATLTVPIAALGVQSIKLASDMVETESKVKVVFGNMTDYVMDWSKGSSKSMQLSRQEALEAAATFGNLFVAMKIGKQDAANMSTTLVQLAADLGSINNIDPSVVLIKLKSGIVGETEAVRDLGIDLRQTVVEVKAAEMGFQKVNGQFEQGALIAARYAIIMEQTKVAQGDIKRTGGELAGQLREMNAQWKDALATLGKNLLPIALKIVTWLNDMLTKFNQLSPAQQKIIGGLILLVAVIGPLLFVLGNIVPLLHMTTKSTGLFHFSILGLITTIVKWIGALAVVVKILSFFGISTGPIGAAIIGLNTAIAGTGSAILAALAPVLILLAGVAFYVGILYVMWRTNFLGMRDNVTMFVKVVKSLWAALMAFLRGDTTAAFKYLGDALQAFQERFAKLGNMENFKAGWNVFLNWLKGAVQGIVTFLSKAFSGINWATIGKFILSGLANGMLGGLPNLLLMASKVATSLLAQIKKSLGIASDSKEAIKLGFYTGHGFTAGVQQGLDPNVIARGVVRSVNNVASSNQQNITMQFANGLTTRQVQSMIADNNEQLMGMLTSALGGA